MAEIVFATATGQVHLHVADLGHDEASLLDAVRHVGLPLGQSCRGEGVCRSCAVDLLAGADQLGPPSPLERRFKFQDTRRLACQARLPAPTTACTVLVAHPAWGRPPPADPAAPAPAVDVTLEP